MYQVTCRTLENSYDFLVAINGIVGLNIYLCIYDIR